MSFRHFDSRQVQARARRSDHTPIRRFALSDAVALLALFMGGWLLATATTSIPTWPDIRRRISKSFPNVSAVTTEELASWLDNSKRLAPVLLDVRSREEYEVSHLPGAVWAEAGKQQRAVLDGQPPTRPVVLYCSVGWRSAVVADRLLRDGKRAVFNLDGSIFQWANEGRPLVDTGNGATHRVHPYDRAWGSLLNRPLWSHDPSS